MRRDTDLPHPSTRTTIVMTMDLLAWMQPRTHRAAARSVSTLCGVGATTSILTAPLADLHVGPREAGAAFGLMVLIILLSVLAHRLDESHRLAWALGPILTVPALVAIDLLTDDASVAAQIFFLFPALYGASQLRPQGAAVMAALSIAGEILVVAIQLPARQAVVEAWYVSAAIATTTALLAVASERHARLVARLEQLAAIDPLTGLSTRRVLDEAAASALSGAGSDAGTALLLLDVDHFKTINDRHGHPAGDAVLVQLAQVLLEHSRPTDVVCRLGGDEIAVLLPACAQPTALARAEEVLAAVRERCFRTEDGTEVAVSISMGCAHLPTHATDLRTLYTAADAALYEAKQAGRGRVAGASGLSVG